MKITIERIIKLVTPLLPEGWSCSEAFGLDMMGGSSPEFVMCSTKIPADARYGFSRNETPEQRAARRERRLAWREQMAFEANTLAELIRLKVKGVRVQKDVTTVYVYIARC